MEKENARKQVVQLYGKGIKIMQIVGAAGLPSDRACAGAQLGVGRTLTEDSEDSL